MWLTLAKGILSRPWIIALVVMAIFMGVQWVKIQSLQGDIVDLQGKMVRVESNFNTCKSNEITLKEAVEQCNNESDEFTANIALMVEQVKNEKERVVYWRDMYNKKICIDPVKDTVSVKPDDRRVLNDETNINVINRINDIFKP